MRNGANVRRSRSRTVRDAGRYSATERIVVQTRLYLVAIAINRFNISTGVLLCDPSYPYHAGISKIFRAKIT